MNGDLLLASGPLIAGRHVHNTVSIDIKRHLDLWHSTRSRGNTIQNEATKRAVIFCKFMLTLEDVDLHAGLIIAGSREDLTLLGRNRGVALDQAGKDTTQRLDTQRKRGYVEQQH